MNLNSKYSWSLLNALSGMSHLCYKGWDGLDRTLDYAAWELFQDILFFAMLLLFLHAFLHFHIMLQLKMHRLAEDTIYTLISLANNTCNAGAESEKYLQGPILCYLC
jgi:hypothetical protein